MNTQVSKRNKFTYATPSIGRDMFYALYSMFILIFLTNAVGVTDGQLIAVGIIMTVARIWDAFNDPIMGHFIDNTTSKFGKFKPWILSGSLISSLFLILLFIAYPVSNTLYVVIFGFLYVLTGMAFTMNDISYWSMYPSFTTNPKEREKIGSLARIFASLGLFITVAFVPIFYQNFRGGPKSAFLILAIFISTVFILSQLVVFFGVKEHDDVITKVKQPKSPFKELFRIIFKNDQLVIIIISILLFNTGYFITTGLGLYFFDYDFNKYGGIEFMLFSGILAVSQLLALTMFPFLASKITRKKIFTIAVLMMTLGFLLFFSVGYILPKNMLVIGFASFVLFSGQGFIQVLVLVMLADTVEYGQWKLGTRNESVVFAINPFVTKLATAFQALVISLTLTLSGLNQKVIKPVTDAINDETQQLTTQQIRLLIASLTDEQMLLILRMSMLIVPLLLILTSYFIYLKKYQIDATFYEKITNDLRISITKKTQDEDK